MNEVETRADADTATQRADKLETVAPRRTRHDVKRPAFPMIGGGKHSTARC